MADHQTRTSETEAPDAAGPTDRASSPRIQFAGRGEIPPVRSGFSDKPPASSFDAPVQLKQDANPPERKANVAAVTAEKSFDDYVVTPETPSTSDPLAGKQTLGGTDLAAVATKPAEAKVLNKLRQNDKRFNAAALLVAQGNLDVKNKTGAFNTETLRQLRAKSTDTRLASTDPNVVVAAIIDEAVWQPFYTGDVELFFAPVDGKGTARGPAPGANARADRVAQAMGYDSWASYSGELQSVSFLGVAAKGNAHPHLVARLAAAESFLRARHPGVDDSEIIRTIGWSGKPGSLVASYGNDANSIRKGVAHFHTMGLAVDFDAAKNPWLYPQSEVKRQTVSAINTKNNDIKERNAAKKPDEQLEDLLDANGIASEWVKHQTNVMDVAFTQAGFLFNGVPLTKAKMMEWSTNLSTEELHARLASAVAALKQYYDLAKSGKDDDIIKKFEAAGFSKKQAQDALPEMRKFPERYDGGFKRGQTKGVAMTHSLELMVALRDAGGLTFGGSEMSHGDNGDFMHFDCRQDPLGQRALGAMH